MLRDSAAPGLLHEFIDLHWDQWRDRIALDIPPGRDRSVRRTATYAELFRASQAIQAQLQPLVQRESIVAILIARATVEAFASILAALRAGGAYLALDPGFPDARIAELLADSQASAAIADAEGARRLARLGFAAERTVVTCSADSAGLLTSEAPAEPASPASSAYVIYTSGTTGRPKGVVVEHRAIANLVADDVAEFGLGAGDRVAQGSSLAYDSSIEEMWLAFAAGATLVVLDDDVVRSGPDLVPWLDRQRITVLCPPPTLLRSTGVRESGGFLPHLRLVYAGGEVLTDDVVDVWAPGRRFVNGYGPTECAVVATRADVVPGGPISIGRPVPGLTAWVMNDTFAEVAPGQVGELCLGGVGVARSYWRQPELTAQRFPTHPVAGRVYRTGDLVRREADGTLTYLGRADSQVKIRGHRVELEEVEARLILLPGVRTAACRVQIHRGRPQLVALVVPSLSTVAPAPAELRAALGTVLPSHMVPTHIRIVNELPVTTGGKVDRAALPEIDLTRTDVVDHADEALAPRTSMEHHIESVLRRLLGHPEPIPAAAHVFQDLGGDSLLAGELVSEFRRSSRTSGLTVRDIYEAPTIRALAARASASPEPAQTGSRPASERPSGRPVLVTLVQAAWLVVELAVVSVAAYSVAFGLLPALAARLGVVPTILVLPALAFAGILAYLPISVALAVAVKRLVVGRYIAVRAPAWGGFYTRNWIVRQALRLVPWRLMEGTIFQHAALRALGARIGRRVHIHRGVDLLQGGWDLLDIGDDVTLGQEAVVRLVDLEHEQIVVAPIAIGDGATIEVRASVAGGATIEPGGWLTALSSLGPGARLSAGERWDGVPAAPAGSSPAAPLVEPRSRVWSPAAHGAVMLVTRLAAALLTPAVAALTVAWLASSHGLTGASIVDWLRGPIWTMQLVPPLLLIGLLPVPISVSLQAVAMRLLGPIRPGVISRWSRDYSRVWIKTDLVRRSGDWLSGSLMWPMWLRAAGMRIGRDCEISTIIDVVPELVDIGPATFFADGVYLGGPRVHRGTVTLAETKLGAEVFLGNHVVIPAGSQVPDGVLVGVCTVGGGISMTAGTSWFGHPPFALSRPAPAVIDRRLTHDPTLIRIVNRWIWEVGRLAIPIAPLVVYLAAAREFARAQVSYSPTTMALAIGPALAVGVAAVLCTLVLVLKWVLLGRVKPGAHPLWSCWCSRWDFHYVVWGRLARPFLSRLDGTLLLAWYLRAMGMRIGRRVVLGPGFAQVVDPDMIQIDDDATVHALFQAHTFEDRILKIDRVRIRSRATVGCGAVLFYGVDVGEGTSVAAQSVIMKRERLQAGRRYEGCPSQPATERSQAKTAPQPSQTRRDRSSPPRAPWAGRASS